MRWGRTIKRRFGGIVLLLQDEFYDKLLSFRADIEELYIKTTEGKLAYALRCLFDAMDDVLDIIKRVNE